MSKMDFLGYSIDETDDHHLASEIRSLDEEARQRLLELQFTEYHNNRQQASRIVRNFLAFGALLAALIGSGFVDLLSQFEPYDQTEQFFLWQIPTELTMISSINSAIGIAFIILSATMIFDSFIASVYTLKIKNLFPMNDEKREPPVRQLHDDEVLELWLIQNQLILDDLSNRLQTCFGWLTHSGISITIAVFLLTSSITGNGIVLIVGNILVIFYASMRVYITFGDSLSKIKERLILDGIYAIPLIPNFLLEDTMTDPASVSLILVPIVYLPAVLFSLLNIIFWIYVGFP